MNGARIGWCLCRTSGPRTGAGALLETVVEMRNGSDDSIGIVYVRRCVCFGSESFRRPDVVVCVEWWCLGVLTSEKISAKEQMR